MTDVMDDLDSLLGLEQTEEKGKAVSQHQKATFLPLASLDRLWGVKCKDVEVFRNSPRRVVVDIVRLFLANKTPITTWGPVGARKTRSIESLSREVDENGVHYQVITVQPSTEDPTVIHGMMFTSLGEDGVTTVMKRSLPSIVDQIIHYFELTGGLTILFLDELSTCLPAQQHALLGLMTHGKYGDKDISPYISIIMAANPEGTVSTVNDLGEQVMNRGGHVAWYGDVELFLEEWGSGFGSPERAPDKKVAWFIQELLNQNPQGAFRNERNWNPDTLVPYERMEVTERSITELARMIGLINETMVGVPTPIRQAYIVEVARALLGEEWAAHAANVAAMEADQLSADSVIARVRSIENLNADMTDTIFKGMMAAANYPLYRLADNSIIRQDQANILITELIDKIGEHGFSKDAYLASWAFAVSAPSQGQIMSNHAPMLRLLEIAQVAVQGGVIPAKNAIPLFVDQTVRDGLRAAATNA